MSQNKKQHVQSPNLEKDDGLIPSDKLIYANIRRFMDKETYKAFPSMATIAKLSGYSELKVKKSIMKLVQHGDIEILPEKHGRNNIYKFNKLSKNFEKFTMEFLDHPDLTADEKAYIIGFQSQSFKDDNYSTSSLTNAEMAEKLHISHDSVIRYNRALIRKGVMDEIATQAKDSMGFRKMVRSIDNNKICQAILFINEKIENHEDRIAILERERESDKKTIEILKRELFKKNHTTPVEFELCD